MAAGVGQKRYRDLFLSGREDEFLEGDEGHGLAPEVWKD